MLIDHDSCTGCMACFNVCPTKAISFIEDKEGFLYPQINFTNCVNCSKCANICPVSKPQKPHTPPRSVYACWSKNNAIRNSSSSGGIFSELATNFLDNGGIVYGAAFSETFQVKHKPIYTKEAISELRGSKYVQSYIGENYVLIKDDLLNGKQVLFVGTPCQVSGLLNYLKLPYEGQLFTVDLICHGVSSPKVFKDYLQFITKGNLNEIKSVNFRSKTKGWNNFSINIIYNNNRSYQTTHHKDVFMIGFLNQLYLRPSCHSCPYSNVNRHSDITLGDFWGYKPVGELDKDNDLGVSAVLINTPSGQLLFDRIKTNLKYFARTIEEVVENNNALKCPFPPSENRVSFWNDYSEFQFNFIAKKYLHPNYHYSKRNKLKLISHIIIHIPNILLRKFLGDSNYTRFKNRLKRKR